MRVTDARDRCARGLWSWTDWFESETVTSGHCAHPSIRWKTLRGILFIDTYPGGELVLRLGSGIQSTHRQCFDTITSYFLAPVVDRKQCEHITKSGVNCYIESDAVKTVNTLKLWMLWILCQTINVLNTLNLWIDVNTKFVNGMNTPWSCEQCEHPWSCEWY